MNPLCDKTALESREVTGAQAAEKTEEMAPPVVAFEETEPFLDSLYQWKEISQFDWREREKKNVY